MCVRRPLLHLTKQAGGCDNSGGQALGSLMQKLRTRFQVTGVSFVFCLVLFFIVNIQSERKLTWSNYIAWTLSWPFLPDVQLMINMNTDKKRNIILSLTNNFVGNGLL